MEAASPHQQLITDLARRSDRTWSEQALLRCLTALAEGGPTDGHLVEIHQAWPLEDEDGFCVVYTGQTRHPVGVRVLRTSSPGWPLYLNDGSADLNDPESFGVEVAHSVIAEPLGAVAGILVRDSDGVGWWGEPPLPAGDSLARHNRDVFGPTSALDG